MRPRAPWWTWLLAIVFVVTLAFNARQEALGPASAGLIPAWPSLTVTRVVPGSAAAHAGVHVDDVVLAVEERPVVSEIDWFVARANFERGRATPIRLRRGDRDVTLTFTITTPNWRSWPEGVIAFQVTRVLTFLLAVVLAFTPATTLTMRLAATIFAFISVAEGFPSAGWLAALRHLPTGSAIPIALASASWLVLPVVWVCLCTALVGEPVRRSRLCLVALASLAAWLPLMFASAVRLVYAPTWMAPPSFPDSRASQLLRSAVGVTPELFLGSTTLAVVWAAASAMLIASGLVVIRRRRLPVAVALGALAIGAHNVLVRNGWIDGRGFVAEAIVFVLLALFVVAQWRALEPS